MLFVKHQSPEIPSEESFCEEMTPRQLSQQLTKDLEGVERLFNMTSDPDLIDAYIFERAALLARLRHLLRNQRQLQQEQEALPANRG